MVYFLIVYGFHLKKTFLVFCVILDVIGEKTLDLDVWSCAEMILYVWSKIFLIGKILGTFNISSSLLHNYLENGGPYGK